MQRYGPPPSYPKLKIPGLNSPIPAGASFGYHPGGWGKPPVNEFGQALYGDVFGTSQVADAEIVVDKSRWGELVEADEESEEEDEDEEDEEEEEKEEEEEEKIDETGFNSVMTSTGYDTPSTTIELRKGIESVTSLPPNEPKQLYTVLEQKTTSIDSNAVYGSDRRYVIPSKKNVVEHVDVALDPSELEGLSEDQIKAKYEEAKESGNVVKAPTRKRKSRFGIRPDAKRARKEEES
jgi:splicing factor 3B subunit 2